MRSEFGTRTNPHQSATKRSQLVTTLDTGLEGWVRGASGRVVGTPESDGGVPVARYAVVGSGSGAVLPATGRPPIKVPGVVAGWSRGERSEPRAASLGTNAVIVSRDPISPALASRVSRRKWERGVSKADRIRRRLRVTAQRVAPAGSNRAKCGRVPVTERIEVADGFYRDAELGVVVRGVRHKYAAYAGLVTCGSAWSCPCCSARIARERGEEVRRAITACRAGSGEVYMLTLTTPHDEGDALAPMMRAVADAFRYILQGRAWGQLKDELGYIGFIRGADEPTIGPKGWHPHLHVLFLFERPLSAQELARFEEHVYSRWVKRIVKHGYREPSRERGVHLAVSHEDRYIAKLGLADELASGMYKQAREGRRTPLQLLVDAAAGDDKALELYREFAEAMHGRKRITWSKERVTSAGGQHRLRSLRARYITNPEQSDEEIAATDETAGAVIEETFAVPVPSRLWKASLADNPDRQSALLKFGKRFGALGVRAYLDLLESRNQFASTAGGGGPPQSFARLMDRIAARVVALWPSRAIA